MSKTMTVRHPDMPAVDLEQYGRTYRPDADGRYEVDDADVESMRHRGLKLEDEPDSIG